MSIWTNNMETGPSPWGFSLLENNNGAITQSNTYAHGGTYSLKLDATTVTDNAWKTGLGDVLETVVSFWVLFGNTISPGGSLALGRNSGYGISWNLICLYSNPDFQIYLRELDDAGSPNDSSLYTLCSNTAEWHKVTVKHVASATAGYGELYIDDVLKETVPAGKNLNNDTKTIDMVEFLCGASGSIWYLDDVDVSAPAATGITEDGVLLSEIDGVAVSALQ